eukprot:UN05084
MANDIRNKDVETVISNMVTQSSAGGFHGLGDASDEQMKQVIDAIIKRKDEFKKITLQNFVIKNDADDDKDNEESKIDVVVNGVKGIFGAVQGADFWPEDARKAMAEQVNNKDIKGVIEYVVKGSADGGYHGLGDATKVQIPQVIDAIYERNDEFKEMVVKNFPL